MSCYVCNLHDSLTCSKCISQSLKDKTSRLKTLQREIHMKRLTLISILNRLPQSKLESLQLQSKLLEQRANLENRKHHSENQVLADLKKLYKVKKQEAESKEHEIIETSLACTSNLNLESLLQNLEKARRTLIEKAVEIYERNIYFPEYCISEMLVLEKFLRHSQIIQDKDGHVSIDKPNFIISFKSKRKIDMKVEYQSEEHNQALNYSIYQICFCINLISQILNFELPFPLKYKFSHFQVKDLSGNKLIIDVLHPYECENALIYVYEDLRILQQHSGVDFSNLRGVLDIPSLIKSQSTGKYFEEPSSTSDVQVKAEVESEDSDWELLGEGDPS